MTEVHREVYLSAVMDAVFLEDRDTVVVALRNSNYLRLFSLAKLEVSAFLCMLNFARTRRQPYQYLYAS